MEDEEEGGIKDFQVFSMSNHWVNSGTIYRNRLGQNRLEQGVE